MSVGVRLAERTEADAWVLRSWAQPTPLPQSTAFLGGRFDPGVMRSLRGPAGAPILEAPCRRGDMSPI